MDRRRYLVTYDVADDERRTKIFRSLMQRGDHTQYSVFMCELTAGELARLRRVLEEMVNHELDQVLLVDLGPAARDSGRVVGSVGRPYLPPIRALVV